MKRLVLLLILAGAAPARAAGPATSIGIGGGGDPVGVPSGGARAAENARAGSVVGSKHDLSTSGPGPIRSPTESQVCIFCHVPHGGGPGATNRPLSRKPYEPYASSTMKSEVPGLPSGTSRICLSCHDGTIALGATVASGTRGLFGVPAGAALPQGKSNLGGKLHRSHPFSFKPAPTAEVRRPPARDPVTLDRAGNVQCTSCHDPHREDLDPVQGKFLVKDNRASALCLSCHAIPGWGANPAAHQASQTQYDQAHGSSTRYRTVAENGCASCHVSHGAGQPAQLLQLKGDEVCLKCHDGRTAKTDLVRELAKPSAHGGEGRGLTGTHNAAEGPRGPVRLPEIRASARRHASCADCHDGHSAFHQPATAPRASGALSGVWGINRSGQRMEQVQNEYEVCFKCHGDSANQPRGPTPPSSLRRARPDVNLRRVFDLGAASSHPIEGPGRGQDVPSLIAPLTTGSVIYCSDCHGSEAGPGTGGSAPRGPHGSIYPNLLERHLSTADRTPEGPGAYALCYKCHDRKVLLSSKSAFPSHAAHLRDGTPCTACHDPHGVSSQQGNPTHNAHLINFDVSIVKPGPKGIRSYMSRGRRAGSCQVSCHGREHDDTSY